jgi:hypothetical protein
MTKEQQEIVRQVGVLIAAGALPQTAESQALTMFGTRITWKDNVAYVRETPLARRLELWAQTIAAHI